MPLNVPVIRARVRTERGGQRVARYMRRALDQREHQATLVDPIEFPLPLLDKMYKEYAPGKAPPVLERLSQIIKPADAYVIVSGEYNHSIPPALSNLLDHFLDDYFFKPSSTVCYSPLTFT